MIERRSGPRGRLHLKQEDTQMKKIMSLALGLSLLGGAVTVASATPDTEKEGKAKSKTKKGKKGTGTGSPKSGN
jgi:hypothetical protein